jgi:hypothetical protein
VQFEWCVPVIKDRVVQAAVVLIVEPIFEADFENCSYGFRPGRNAHQALEQIAAALKAGKTEVYDADLEGYRPKAFGAGRKRKESRFGLRARPPLPTMVGSPMPPKRRRE